ncbi:hypothetical protein H072_9018 [Dactylellina haptotyla CBS 200.50]|uniref:Uncharacterized protein n=1 Tax=Dactylellina haptotyla (strain CBS 200.50) TaxID=1284197 RepID=S8BDE2_DACHA|nr:hypothetical protein H072_9018 [Dactylellina haptotyla CBS 200.50]
MHFTRILSALALLAITATALPTIETRTSNHATGASLKQEFTTYAEDLDQPRKNFIASVQMTVWDQLADLQNKVNDMFASTVLNEGLVHQLSYAKGSIYECTIPDFATLPTTLIKPPNNCPAS